MPDQNGSTQTDSFISPDVSQGPEQENSHAGAAPSGTAAATREQDVANCYKFFLAREAEAASVLREKLSFDAPSLALVFSRSEEFASNVLDPVARHEPLREGAFDASPPRDLLRWASEFFPLADATRHSLRESTSWYAAYHLLFSDARMCAAMHDVSPCSEPEAEGRRRFIGGAARILDEMGHSVKDVWYEPDAVVVTVEPSRFAPLSEHLLCRAHARDPEIQSHLGVERRLEGGVESFAISHSGAALDRIKVDVEIDGELLIHGLLVPRGVGQAKDDFAPGRVDQIGPNFVSGWLVPENPNASRAFRVEIAGEHVGSGLANLGRPDVTKLTGLGTPGFLYPIPKRFKNGRNHEVTVRRDSDGAVLPSRSNILKVGSFSLTPEWRQDNLLITVAGVSMGGLDRDVLVVVADPVRILLSYVITLRDTSLGVEGRLLIPSRDLFPYLNETVTVSCPVLLAEHSVDLSADRILGEFIGKLDGIDGEEAYGWCAYRGNFGRSATVDVLIDDQLVTRVTADHKRSDLQQHVGSTRHGFRCKIPPEFLDGRPHILIVRDPFSRRALAGSPREFAISRGFVGSRAELSRSLISNVSGSAPVNEARRQPTTTTKPVTAIILTRNGAPVLAHCLESIWHFVSNDAVKVVVVDHGSTDSTAELVSDWSNRLHIVYERVEGNNSFSHANNAAFHKHVDSPFVLLLNNDIILMSDAVSRMRNLLEQDPSVGIVGCKLIEARDRESLQRSYVHHTGILLGLAGDGLVHAYEANIDRPLGEQYSKVEAYSVTGACCLIRSEDYAAIGGLEESYFYGGEDVELGERIWSQLGKRVVCLNDVAALHHRGWYRLTARGEGTEKRVNQNEEVLQKRIGYQLRKRHQLATYDPDHQWSLSKGVIGFVVVEAGPLARTGEYFTALELARALQELEGHRSVFIEPGKDWYDVSGVTCLVNMLHEYDISTIKNARPDLIKVAWLRNNFELWASSGSLSDYHLVFCSSRPFCDFLAGEHGIVAYHLPIASNVSAMETIGRSSHRTAAVLFNGSHSGAARTILTEVDPEAWGGEFEIYGHGWEAQPELEQFWRGFLPYERMGDLYSSAKIVIDHAQQSAAYWGGTNSRVFDAIAAGCLPISNSLESSATDFDGLLPTWSDAVHLQDQIRFYLDNDAARRERVGQLQGLLNERHTYDVRARQFMSSLKGKLELGSVAIKIGAPSVSEARSWGDTHLAEALAVKLRQRGIYSKVQTLDQWHSRSEHFDAAIVLRGLSRYQPAPQQLNLLWLISHPDQVAVEELKNYDKVAFASQKLADAFGPLSGRSSIVRQFSIFNDGPGRAEHGEACGVLELIAEDDVIFVGNTRGVRRSFILDVHKHRSIKFIGSGWDHYVRSDHILGEEIENALLPFLYRKALVVINDHWGDMAQSGIISNRICDVLMSGGMVLSDWHDEGVKLLGHELFCRSADEFNARVSEFARNPLTRQRLIIEKGKLVSQLLSADSAADTIVRELREAHGRRMGGWSPLEVEPSTTHTRA